MLQTFPEGEESDDPSSASPIVCQSDGFFVPNASKTQECSHAPAPGMNCCWMVEIDTYFGATTA